MLTQIENTAHGYIAGVYIYDGAGNGQWMRLRNFGSREGHAIEYCDYDIPKLSDAMIIATAKRFNIERKYKRKGFLQYELE